MFEKLCRVGALFYHTPRQYFLHPPSACNMRSAGPKDREACCHPIPLAVRAESVARPPSIVINYMNRFSGRACAHSHIHHERTRALRRCAYMLVSRTYVCSCRPPKPLPSHTDSRHPNGSCTSFAVRSVCACVRAW